MMAEDEQSAWNNSILEVHSYSMIQAKYAEIARLREALTDIRNRALCPVGPAPTVEQLGNIASKALAHAPPPQS